MQILKESLTIHKGTRFRYDLAITEDGATLDLSGYSAKIQVRDELESEIVLLELTTGTGHLSFSGSTLLIRISGAETDDYAFNTSEYDCKIWPASGETNADMVMQGKFIVKKLVTRSP